MLKDARSSADSSILKFLTPVDLMFGFILRKENVRTLGRTVNLSKIFSQSVVNFVRGSFDAMISRFESSDFTFIVVI
jgi:hypothetical protein